MTQSVQLPCTGLLNEAEYPDRTLVYRERVNGPGASVIPTSVDL